MDRDDSVGDTVDKVGFLIDIITGLFFLLSFYRFLHLYLTSLLN